MFVYSKNDFRFQGNFNISFSLIKLKRIINIFKYAMVGCANFIEINRKNRNFNVPINENIMTRY